MRFAVLADIHGNLVALEAVLRDAKQHNVDGVWVLGDSIVGPAQNDVMGLLRSLDGYSCIIRGNAEGYLLDCDEGPADEWHQCKQWAPVLWAYRDIDPATLDFVASLPEQRTIDLEGANPVRLVHGSPTHVREPVFPTGDRERMRRFKEAGFLVDGRQPVELGAVLSEIDERVLACGHTHIPWIQRKNGRLAFNPGSVGSPMDGDTRAQYAVLTWDGERQWRAELRGVAYDLEHVRQSFVQSGFWEATEAWGRASWLSVKTGQNVTFYLVMYARRLAAQAGLGDGAIVPDPIWDRAVETLDWTLAASGKALF